MLYIVIWLIIVGIIVVYLSIDEKKENINQKFDYKNTDFFYELKKIEIKNDNILKLKEKVQEYIIWTDNLINSIIVAILSDGHILVEWVPGLAKTRTILVFSKLLWLNFKRVQFTPDMLPSDIIGWEIYNKNTWKFEIFKWPIFTNLLLADEINRATPKVQSALLEAMQEKKVTIGNETFVLNKPFFVMATQNPLEQEWTFPLPEAQLDRFLFKVNVTYPSKEEEKLIMDAFDKNIDNIESIFSSDSLLKMQEDIKNIKIEDREKKYIVDIVDATRKNEKIEVGASTRAVIALKKASLTVAYLQWKEKVSIDDIKKVLLLVLRHRVKLKYNVNEPLEKILIETFIKVNDL